MSTSTPWPYDTPRRRPSPVSQRRAEQPDWAAHPRRMRRRDGTVVEVFGIGALGSALTKSSFTLRRWERLGILPETPLLQAVRGGPPRRMFLREQIQGILLVAEQEGVAGHKPADFSRTNFTARVAALYASLFPDLG